MLNGEAGVACSEEFYGFVFLGGEAFAGGSEIAFVDVKAGVGGDFHAVGCDGGCADAIEGVEQVGLSAFSMDADALFDEADGEGGGVWTFLGARLDGVVGDEPVVPTAAFVFTVGVAPAGDVGFVRIGHACGTALEGDVAGFGEVEDVFVAVVDVALAVDGFEVSGADGGVLTGFYGDGFDPVEGILEGEEGTWAGGEGEQELVGQERVFRGGADVQEKRGVTVHEAFDF